LPARYRQPQAPVDCLSHVGYRRAAWRRWRSASTWPTSRRPARSTARRSSAPRLGGPRGRWSWLRVATSSTWSCGPRARCRS